jgi:hypothetical protein
MKILHSKALIRVNTARAPSRCSQAGESCKVCKGFTLQADAGLTFLKLAGGVQPIAFCLELLAALWVGHVHGGRQGARQGWVRR